MNKALLDQLKIILVRTSHPGNIGATARAMKNMGMTRLVLVNPKSFPHVEATARASGAEDVLAAAQTTEDLKIAIKDCHIVVGTSSRPRALSAQTLIVSECAQLMMQKAKQGKNIGILFGSERTGLTNEEMDLCHYFVNIPSNPEYSSLNLAAAVQIVCYELWQAHLTFCAKIIPPKTDLATQEEVELFYIHLEKTLGQIGFLHASNPRQLMRKLRRFFNRVQIEKNELHILRGILATIDKTLPNSNFSAK